MFALFFGALALRDIARDAVDDVLRRVGCGVPAQPSVRAVLAAIAILEGKRLAAATHLRVLVEGALPIVGMDELDESAGGQFLTRVAKGSLPGFIDTPEVSIEVEKADHVDCILEEAVFLLLLFLELPGVVAGLVDDRGFSFWH